MLKRYLLYRKYCMCSNCCVFVDDVDVDFFGLYAIRVCGTLQRKINNHVVEIRSLTYKEEILNLLAKSG